MLNNIRISIPFHSKDSAKNYKFSGIAHYIFCQETERIVFNTIELKEATLGASNLKNAAGGEFFYWEKVPKRKKFRMSLFDSHDKPKSPSELHLPIDIVAKEIWGLTVKNGVSLFIGANAAGEIKRPESSNIIADINVKGLENPYIFGLLSNISAQNQFHSLEEVLNIDEVSVEQFIFDYAKDTKYKPRVYVKKETAFEYVIESTFSIIYVNQNYDRYSNEYVIKYPLNTEYVAEIVENKLPILDIIEKQMNIDMKIAKSSTRNVWNNNVTKTIKKDKFVSDFVHDRESYHRAHIIENNLLAKNSTSEEILKLINPENFLLLELYIHKYWDDGKIKIDPVSGDIINVSLSEKEFAHTKGNIYSIYPNSKTEIRISLLKERYTN